MPTLHSCGCQCTQLHWEWVSCDNACLFSRWLCALIGMVVVGFSVICVSTWEKFEEAEETHTFTKVHFISNTWLKYQFKMDLKHELDSIKSTRSWTSYWDSAEWPTGFGPLLLQFVCFCFPCACQDCISQLPPQHSVHVCFLDIPGCPVDVSVFLVVSEEQVAWPECFPPFRPMTHLK